MTPTAKKTAAKRTPAKKTAPKKEAAASIWGKASTRSSTAPADSDSEDVATPTEDEQAAPVSQAVAVSGDVIPAGMLRLPSGRLMQTPTEMKTYKLPVTVIDLIEVVKDDAYQRGVKLTRQDIVANAITQTYGHMLDQQ